MARPIKNTVDYFPHDVSHGKTIYILESKYGNDGYAFWFKLLELLGSTDNHVYDYNNPPDWEFLLAITKVDEEKAISILKTLAEVEAIDKELWKEKKVWSNNFVHRLEEVYKRRSSLLPQKPCLCKQKPSTPVVFVDNNSQSKVEESIVEEIKEEIKKESQAPSNKKTKDNLPLEFDFINKEWIGLYNWRINMFSVRYPMLTINYLLEDKYKKKFLEKPKEYMEMIKVKYNGKIENLIWAWLRQEKKFYLRDHPDYQQAKVETVNKSSPKGMSHIGESEEVKKYTEKGVKV